MKINANWTTNASEHYGDNLNYAILVSLDNGTTYNTLNIDISSTNYTIDSLDLVDGKNYLVKVLATDGINTNYTVANQTFEIDNDLQINEFRIVYQNNTERVFKIALNNTLSSTISNITWQLNTGESIKNSTLLSTLQSGEQMLFFIYHNYSTSGSYNTTFTARSGNYIESETIQTVV